MCFAVIAFAASLAIAFVPVGAPPSHQPGCTIHGEKIAPAALAADGAHWQCQGNLDRTSSQDALLRYDLDAQAGEPAPRYLRSRIGLFDRLAISVVDEDGETRSIMHDTQSVQLIAGEPYFLVELPQVRTDSKALFVQFERARHDATVLRAKLFVDDPTRHDAHFFALLFIAVLLGMMLIPAIFDLAFYQALKTRFLLWHAGLSLSFAGLVVLRSGLVLSFVDISLEAWRFLLITTLGVSIYFAAQFTCAFIEEGELHPRLRKAINLAGYWALLTSLIHAVGFEALAPFGGSLHTFALAPVLLIFAAVMVDAFRRGSRSARFQIIGWIPLFFAFSLQLLSYVSAIGIPTDALPIFYFGVLSETTITAIGVADRFLALRRERDEAVTEAEMMERLSERDPLTGLLNRRAIDEKFEDLHAEGFDTFALIDLDHFKSVNDTEGHQVGDRVLKVAANAMAADKDSMAIRMGGEEFLILLRGPDTFERAEKLRQSIPLRIAQQVAELDHLVTASMGVLKAPREAMPTARFADIYSRADILLYSAKEQGRNRPVTEKVQPFNVRRERRRIRGRRRADRAA